ncbi:biopolymer transporter ExbB [Komagataeibacter rhaeticus]|uniref:Biopolymer transport protein ExbB n=2 Tax=Komagataeibacter rhaeticus TaxID=215221 RepID=A0A181C6V4_9PROT|nr:MotA/TolQ/ExbB proton channel family protein [Komagataeibacter rhaeticus]ATU73832.1 biopolymer transporter ExbB [Komagataeibacter xylinus]EGG78411.1 Biopolymer transport protein exbB [Gluconacetobacter sp. SXCC-1]PYD55078.1 biopolymer transporter ExbB [Komagataeibacter rhaeticus]QIP34272.1 MotA/TolQ/ExbB proton channel family protein [Komagataeibacter rhaeticus]QOC46782.1 MotA/TolQ/ExbB proton channel family protein [Komagataeibacter rhaeticus]
MIRLHRKHTLVASAAFAAMLCAASPLAALAQDAAPAASDAATAPAVSAPPTDGNGAPATPAPGADAPAVQAPAATDAAPAAPAEAPPAPAPAPAPAADAAPPADAPKAPEGNPYGLGALWANGDFIARGVLLIMVFMSLGTWYIMITKFFEQARVMAAAKQVMTDFWTKGSIKEGAAALPANSPFRYIADTGVKAAEHHEGTMQESIDLHSWTTMSIQRSVDVIQTKLQGGLAFLGTVGSTSPFVGLFGTVWGIYHALTAIGIAGQASIDKVAGPVGESLIMTAIGLGTAVPAVLGYNLLVRRNKGAIDKVRNFAADVQSILMGGYRHGAEIVVHPDNSPTTTTIDNRVG